MTLSTDKFELLRRNHYNRKAICIVGVALLIFSVGYALITGRCLATGEAWNWFETLIHAFLALCIGRLWLATPKKFATVEDALSKEPIVANVTVVEVRDGEGYIDYRVTVWETQDMRPQCFWEGRIDSFNFSSFLNEAALFRPSLKTPLSQTKVWLSKGLPAVIELDGRLWELSLVTEVWR